MNIENKIRQFIVQNLYFTEDNFIADDVSFLETGVIDSMGVMELVAFVQSEFSVEVAQAEVVVENFDSIHKLANFVRRKLSVVGSPASQPEAAASTTPASVPSR
jgi:acyl carrier protein